MYFLYTCVHTLSLTGARVLMWGGGWRCSVRLLLLHSYTLPLRAKFFWCNTKIYSSFHFERRNRDGIFPSVFLQSFRSFPESRPYPVKITVVTVVRGSGEATHHSVVSGELWCQKYVSTRPSTKVEVHRIRSGGTRGPGLDGVGTPKREKIRR